MPPAPTLLLWSQMSNHRFSSGSNITDIVRCLSGLGFLDIYGTGGRIGQSGVASATLSCCATAVAALPRPLCSYGRKMSNLRFSSGSNITDIVRCLSGLGFLDIYGPGGRTRTGTLLRASDFESDVSTNFTTPAQRGKHFISAGRGL